MILKQFKNDKTIVFLPLMIIAIFFFCSCMAKNPMIREQELMNKMASKHPYSFIKKGFAGIDVINNKRNEVEIYEVYGGTPADEANVKPGDILLEAKGVEIKKRAQLFDILDSMYPNETVSFKIRRNGQEIEKNLTLSTYNYPNDFYALLGMVYKDNDVRLAVLPGEIQNMYNIDAELLEKWKKSAGTEIVGYAESTYINFFRTQKNFIVIDRHQTDKILNEIKFQNSGLVSDEQRKQIGKLLGATHIVTVNLTRHISTGSKPNDTMTRRLVEVESGKILATFAVNSGDI